jgi:hypothetical protein
MAEFALSAGARTRLEKRKIGKEQPFKKMSYGRKYQHDC